jgi:hypothetical protein
MNNQTTIDKRFIDTDWQDNESPCNAIHFSHNSATLNGTRWDTNDGKTFSAESNDNQIVVYIDIKNRAGYNLTLDTSDRLMVSNNIANYFSQVLKE